MKSTRDDVRRILKQPGDGSILEFYSVRDATLDVSYSYGKCTNELNSGWNVPADVVIGMSFTPLIEEIRFSGLKLNLRKFKKIGESPHVPEIITYINKDEGIKYVVQADGLVSEIGFFSAVTI